MPWFNFKKFIGITLMGLSISSIALAHTTSPLILSQLIATASQHNPQIKSAYDRWLAMKRVAPQVRSLPDPKLIYSDMQMSGNPEMNQNPLHEKMLGLDQEVPFPGKLIERGKIANIESERTYAEYVVTKLTIIAQLKRIFYDLYFVNQSIEIYQKNQLLLEKIEKSVRTNYSVGKIPQQDIFRAQTEISRLQMRLVMLKQERTSLQADINRLLNRSLATPIETPSHLSITPLHFDLQYFNNLIEKQSPQLKSQWKNVKKSEKAITLSKMDYVPDIDISYGEVHDTEMHTSGYQLMASASIPLYFFSKQNNMVRESEENYNADIENLYVTHNNLLFQIKNAYLMSKRSEELIQLIQHSIIPQATLTFSSGQASYGVGKVDFLTLLNNLLMLQDNELELQKEIVQHEKAMTDIEEVTGINL
ncbi:MAG: PTS cellobiose transporter subunit IIC [Gammaproteobacteria bacterium RIFCSPHIGHO2_12_FULL_40_19]|nr:MAG: PTS cellobiose transporter subunit IIC [Gammaproteobacteria bacterium RIFCSPHIGHO2_12_FULL_40_19]